MVLIIKVDNMTFRDIVVLVAKHMINTETGRTYYDDMGNENKAGDIKDIYNIYKTPEFEYKVHPVCGNIFFRVNNVIDCARFVEALADVLSTLDESIDYYTNKSGVSAFTTQYTLFTTDIRREDRRRVLTQSDKIKNKSVQSGMCRFTWLINELHMSSMYLPYGSNFKHVYDNAYLNNSLSTIIVDGCDIYSVPNMYRQINYPDIDIMRSGKGTLLHNVYTKSITVGMRSGLHSEIFKYYTGNSVSVLHNDLANNELNIGDLSIRERYPDKNANESLIDIYQYFNKKLIKSNVTTDELVCYFTGVRLWDYACVYKVKNIKYDESKDESKGDIEAKDNDCGYYHILVSQAAKRMMEKSSKLFRFMSMSGYRNGRYNPSAAGKMDEIGYINIKYKALDVISDMPDGVYKDILYSIEKYGCQIQSNSTMISINHNKKMMYVGICGSVSIGQLIEKSHDTNNENVTIYPIRILW